MDRLAGGGNGQGTGRLMDVTPGQADGTNGTGPGTNSILSRMRPFLFVLLLILVSNTVNVMTILQDAARGGHATSPVMPIMTEGTSGIVILLVAFIPAFALARAPIQSPWPRQVLVHALGLLVFSCLHIVGMSVARQIAAGTLGLNYAFPVTIDVLKYEFRKDTVSYFVTVMIFLACGHGRIAMASAGAFTPSPADLPRTPIPGANPAPDALPSAEQWIDIRDGTMVHRVVASDIIAVRSAANYVEFLLVDGRRPMMRATLTQLAGDLAAHGILRTHRSWLVNRVHVKTLRPAGSGDHELTLSDGSSVPLSRRYPDALAGLRG